MKEIIFKPFLLLVFVLALANSCVDSYMPRIDGGDASPVLVVEGEVTNEEGPFRVKLSRTEALNKPQIQVDSVLGADVRIIDDLGTIFQLSYTKNGWYETADQHLKGVPERTYTLNITTDDGQQYESTPVRMLDAPDIDSVYFREEAVTSLENQNEVTGKQLNIYVDSKPSAGSPEFLKWTYSETWEIHMNKQDIRVKTGESAGSIVNMNVDLAPGIKEKCWITKPSASILIGTGKNNPRNNVSGMLLTSIKQGDDRLNVKYSILVKQYALSEEMYRFWKMLKEANEQTGGMYDRIPAQTFGNIDRCDQAGKALGYFGASAVRSERIFINPGDQTMKSVSPYAGCIYTTHPNPRVVVFVYGTSIGTGETVYTQDLYCSDCRIYGSGVEPGFWQ